MAVEDTLPKLLKRNCELYGDKRVAMRVKDRGIWQEYTWKDYYEKVKCFSLGLTSLGLKAGDKVSILGENKPQWYWAELAVQASGAVAVGIYTDCTPPEVKYFVEHSDSTFVVVHDQEQVDKLLQIKDELPLLKKVIYWDPKGMWYYKDPVLISFDEVLELGRKYEETHPGLFEENVEKGKADDIAVLCYTSGTGGLPKAAMLPHEGLTAVEEGWAAVDPWDESDEYLSFLPPAWVTEQAIGIAGGLVTGMKVNFPEEPETVQENIREIAPQVLFYGPRLWESVTRTIQAKITDTTRLKRFLYHLFLPVGYKVSDLRLARKKPSLLWRALYLVGDGVLFRPLRDKVGMSKIKYAYTAGAAVSPDIIRLFQAIGVNIKQLYGGSEVGLVTLHRDGDIRPETSGTVLPISEIKLSDEGEILVKNKYMFAGYYKNPEATQVTMKEGWFYTGDFGYIDEAGHLIVMDRMADVRGLAGGRKFSPQYVEVRLRFSPYIKDVMVVGGEDKEYVTAIVNIDIENVSRWASARRIAYTTFTDLSQKPEVIDLIRGDLARVNKILPEWSRIRKFVNLHKEFDPDEAELTRTRKLRRTFVEDRYSDLINALYGEEPEFVVEASVTYRDGRKGVMTTSIKITPVD